MKILVLSLFLIITFFTLELHAESYQDCIIKNMKNVNDRLASAQIMIACRDKTTPKKCRNYLKPNIQYIEIPRDTLDEKLEPERYLLYNCLRECEQASFFERRFGECSTD